MHLWPFSFIIIDVNSLLEKIDYCLNYLFYLPFAFGVHHYQVMSLLVFVCLTLSYFHSYFHIGSPNQYLQSYFLFLCYTIVLHGLLRTLISRWPCSVKFSAWASNDSIYLLSNPVCVFVFLELAISCSYWRAFVSSCIN